MKIHPLFDKHQDLILKFANTYLGKHTLTSKHKDKYVVKVTPNSIHYLKGFREDGSPIITADFYSAPIFAKKLATALTGIDIARESFSDLKAWYENPGLIIPSYGGLIVPRFDLPKTMLAITDFNSDADPESTSVDGYVGVDYGSTPYTGWAAHVAGATGSDAGSNGSTLYMDITDLNSADKFSLYRLYMLFDTSSLAGVTVIDSATWNFQFLSVTGDSSNWTFNDTLVLVSSNPASNTTLTTADYNDVGSVNFGTEAGIFGKSLDTAYDIPLSASGIANIDVSGISKFGVRYAQDYNNQDPNASTGKSSRPQIYSSDSPSTPRIHYLEVDYVPVSGFLGLSLMGVGK